MLHLVVWNTACCTIAMKYTLQTKRLKFYMFSMITPIEDLMR